MNTAVLYKITLSLPGGFPTPGCAPPFTCNRMMTHEVTLGPFHLSVGGTCLRLKPSGHLWGVDRQMELTVPFLTFRDYVAGGACPSKATIQGKTVIVTGANTGIGKQTALELAKRGEALPSLPEARDVRLVEVALLPEGCKVHLILSIEVAGTRLMLA